MATDPAATRKLWEDAFREKRELITTLDPAKLDRPTANAGWTVRNLAAHVAMGSDSPIGMAAPKLSRGKNILPVPIPGFLFKKIGDISNGREVRKYATATPDALARLMDESHAKAAAKLNAVPADGWDRKGLIPTIGRLTLAEFVEYLVKHDRDHADVLKQSLA